MLFSLLVVGDDDGTKHKVTAMASFATHPATRETEAAEGVRQPAGSAPPLGELAAAEDDDIINEAVSEDKVTALQEWWARHGDNLMKWFTSITAVQREAFVKGVAPDIPKELPGIRASKGEVLRPTDILLPELTLDGLLGGDGKLLGLFLSRRLTPRDRCFMADIVLLNGLMERGALPSFSNGQLVGMDTPFVDPSDAEENVRSLSPQTSAANRAEILKYLEKGRLVHAEVWVALRMRRDAIVSFMSGLVTEFEEAMYDPTKRREYEAAAGSGEVVEFFDVSPTYEALLRGELEQQRMVDEMLAKKQQEEKDQAKKQETGSNAPAKT